MYKDEIKTLKANGIKWSEGMDVDAKEYEGVYISGVPTDNTKTQLYVHNVKLIHGEKYDYSDTVFTGIREQIKVICNEHGVFSTDAANHKNGSGCSRCGYIAGTNKHKLTTVEFIQRATEVHGSRFGYSRTKYVDARKRVIVTCKIHGDFKTAPYNHLNGSTCRKCTDILAGERSRKSTEAFISGAIEVFGNLYDYSMVDYVHGKKHVTIICRTHGEFMKTPSDHLNNGGCQSCTRIAEHSSQIYIVKYTCKESGKVYHKIGITELAGGYRKYEIATLQRYYIDLEDFFTVDTVDARLVERLLLAAARSIYGEVTCTDILEGRVDGKTEMIPYNPQLVNDFEEWADMYEKLT